MCPTFDFPAEALNLIERQRLVDPAKALSRCRAYVKAHPQSVDGYLVLARCLVDARRENEAVVVLRKAQSLDSERVDVMVFLGNIALYLQQVEEAGDVFEKAMRTNAQIGAVHLGLGRVLAIRGEVERAHKCFTRALALEPTLPGVALHLSRSRKFSTDDKSTIVLLERLLRNPDLSSSARADLHFGLGKINDDCCDYDLAFRHYERANQLVSDTVSFDRIRFARSLDLLCLSFSTNFFDSGRASGQLSQTPIFIVGMPRSGTTLVEQILSSHSVVHGGGELAYIDQLTREIGAPVPYPRAAIGMGAPMAFELSERYLEKIKTLSPNASRIADKMPTNFFHLGFIASLFPKAHIIHCRRQPLDTCVSIYFQQFETGNEWAYKLSDIAFFYKGYLRTMSHWQNVLPVPIHEVHYESLIRNPEETTRQMVDYCGLPWETGCLDFHNHPRPVLTSSSWQVRQPLYSQSVERWKRYDSYLDPLRRELEH